MGYPHKTLGGRIEYDPNGGCWLWSGSLCKDGYGRVTRPGDGGARHYRAHREVYEAYRGPVAAGLVLDHLCRVRCCVNPAHLEPVTMAENRRRGSRPDLTPKGIERTPSGRFQVRICVNRRAIRLGTFDTEAEALAAYREAQDRLGQSGAKPCAKGAPNRCEFPVARNH